jgi:hypothetical protein
LIGRACSKRVGVRNAHKILVRKSEGKRPFKDFCVGERIGIKINLKEIWWDDVDWSHLAQDILDILLHSTSVEILFYAPGYSINPPDRQFASGNPTDLPGYSGTGYSRCNVQSQIHCCSRSAASSSDIECCPKGGHRHTDL